MRTILFLVLCLLIASCRTMTSDSAEQYLTGKWQFDREAKDLGYLDEMPDGDDYFVSFSSNKLVVTYVEGDEIEAFVTDVDSILVDPDGIIEIRKDKTKDTSPPEWIFQKIDANHVGIGSYDFYAPLRRMRPLETIPKSTANQKLEPTRTTPIESGND